MFTNTSSLKPHPSQPATRVEHRARPTIYIDTSAILEALLVHLYVFSPLEIGTSFQTSELEIVEDKRAAGQVEEIYEGQILQK